MKDTAKCKVCKKVIEKSGLRIGKPAMYKDQIFLQYHHIQCIFKKFHNARIASNVVSNTDDLIGFTEIAEADQTYLKQLITSENESRNRVLPAEMQKRKARVAPDAPLHVRKARLKPLNAEALNVLYTNADQLTTSKMAELRLRIQQEKPMVVAVCEVKPKNAQRRHDYDIPGFSLHHVNLDTSLG